MTPPRMKIGPILVVVGVVIVTIFLIKDILS
jgi:hypothetical protein